MSNKITSFSPEPAGRRHPVTRRGAPGAPTSTSAALFILHPFFSPQATSFKTRTRIRFHAAGWRLCSKLVRRDVRHRHRGQRPTATADPHTKPPVRRPSRHCSRVRRPRFPHLAPRPHPSRHGHESASSQLAVASAQKSFGETFGTATGVSDPRLQKTRIRTNHAGGQAATVAGYAGPGFHTWPQATSLTTRLRIRCHAAGPRL
jgi:hypothetical protein